MASVDTSAMRRSRSVFDARSTAALAAFSHDSELVPTSSITLYTLSAIPLALLEVVLIALVRRLEQPRRAHPAADAHGDDPPSLLSPPELVEQRSDHSAAGHAGGVADRDRAAVRVELLGVDAEPIAAVDHLRGERLVQLDDVDLVEAHAVDLQELRHREHRADAHLVRLARREDAAPEDAERPDAERLGALGGHDERRRRAEAL